MKKSFFIIFVFLSCFFPKAQNEFITIWKPSNTQNTFTHNPPYASSTTQIWAPFRGNNFTIYWEENGYPTHNVTLTNVTSSTQVLLDFGTAQNPNANAATYTVKVSNGNGNFHQIMFRDATLGTSNSTMGDTAKMIDISQWGNIHWSAMENAFAGCNNLNITATDIPDLSSVNNLNGTFLGCTSLIGNNSINNWNISSVNSLVSTFSSCSIFNQPLNNWNTSNVTYMENTFHLAKAFNQPLSNWDTSNVIDMTAMFNNAQSFNQPLDNWNVSSNTDCEFMFSNAWAFNQPLNNWNVSNVVLFQNMFNRALAFNSNISEWNTSSAVNMSGMFQYTPAFNQNISSWNTSNVTIMSSMFQNATAFNQNIGNWNTSHVTTMVNMFNDATSFNQNLGSWNLSSLLYASSIFNNSGLNCQNYDSTLYGWRLNPLTPNNISISNASPMIYSHPAAVAARNFLISNKGWSISGDSYNPTCVSALSIDEASILSPPQIYPNPATDFIYLKNFKALESFKIFDYSGRILMQNIFKNYEIDIRTLKKGNYILQLKTKNAIESFKFIKK